ncbi:MAG: CGNR zinc finger domain-containing protein [Acidimicrobiales bacterium]
MTGRSEFAFGGRLCLDLTWTVRYRAIAPTELLVDAGDVRRWLMAVGLPAPELLAGEDLAAVRALREAIHAAAVARIDGRRLSAANRDLVNRRAAAPSPFPVLGTGHRRHLSAPAGQEVAAALSAVARDAIDLLATAGDGRLRRCSGPLCSLLFHDGSRPGTRRWCDTARCGNKVNTTTYRQRRRERD